MPCLLPAGNNSIVQTGVYIRTTELVLLAGLISVLTGILAWAVT
jgi:hypothetical protein